jgi:hypothetical protein
MDSLGGRRREKFTVNTGEIEFRIVRGTTLAPRLEIAPATSGRQMMRQRALIAMVS